MKRFLPGTIAIVTAISPLFVSQSDAYCARCVKIEEERAKEQAANPQSFHYYDDLLSLQEERNLGKDKAGSNPSENPTQTETGTLSGSTSRTTENPTPAKTSASSKQSLLAVADRPIDSSLLKETNTPNSKEKETENSGTTATPGVESPTAKGYSAIYTVLKTKNFLEALDGNYTIFIPTNQAIQAVQAEKLIALAREENAEKLAALVSNHVVAKKILRKDFIEGNNQEVKAISGRNLTLSYKNGSLYVDGIKILRAEPGGFDGVIYVVEKVIRD